MKNKTKQNKTKQMNSFLLRLISLTYTEYPVRAILLFSRRKRNKNTTIGLNYKNREDKKRREKNNENRKGKRHAAKS